MTSSQRHLGQSIGAQGTMALSWDACVSSSSLHHIYIISTTSISPELGILTKPVDLSAFWETMVVSTGPLAGRIPPFWSIHPRLFVRKVQPTVA